MKKFAEVVFLASATCGAFTSTLCADPIIYATAGAGKSLVRIDVATQRVTTIGDFGVAGANAIAFNSQGIAYTITHGWPPGGESQLARVNLINGAATVFGVLNQPENFMGLGFAPDGALYGINAGSGTTNAGSLYRFDASTGNATKVGLTGGCFDIMDLAWGTNGTMYGAVNDSLYRVDPATGQATLVTKLQGVSRVMGLAIDKQDVFYVSEIVTNAPLLRVDPATGNTTKLFDTGVDFIHGMDIARVLPPLIRSSDSLQSKASYPGMAVSFTVNAFGVPPLTYQWRRNGQDLVGDTARMLTLTSVKESDAADYSVEVSNPGGTVVSSPVHLWVVPPASDFQRLDFTNAVNERLPYFLLFPPGYDPARRYPLVLWVHGGCTWNEETLPADFWNWPIIGAYASYELQARDPRILVVPTHRNESAPCGWSSAEIGRVSELLDKLMAELPVDADRVYVQGGSSALAGTVELLRLRPDLFAAAVLASGDALAHPSLAHLPIWTVQTLEDGFGLGAFAQQLRAYGGHPIHTEFKSAGHTDAGFSVVTTPAVVDWFFSQKRGMPSAAGPSVKVNGLDTASVRRTGATSISLTGSADPQGGRMTGVTWRNTTTRLNGQGTGTSLWQAGPVPLLAEQTNVLVVTAAMDATWIPGQAATTTFSETVSVFSTPMRLNVSIQGENMILNWTGGVPPFSVEVRPTLGAANWTELLNNAVPPVTLPAAQPMQLYRVGGR